MSDDDFSHGMSALLGRAIGEISGMQRRIELLERQVQTLQDRRSREIARRDARLNGVFFIVQILVLTGLFLGLSTWPELRSAI